jgi:DNA-binding transcriptional MerR regulator
VRSHDVSLRTNLSRDQLRYCEEKGYLGEVARGPSGERQFTEDQVRFFENLSALRDAGLSLEDAAAIAAESVGGSLPRLDQARL